jgi:hypothetical protein
VHKSWHPNDRPSARSLPGTPAAGTLALITVNAMGFSAERTCLRRGRLSALVERRVDPGKDADADAIVVGPRGLGTIGRALLASLSGDAQQTAGRPVIVLREGIGAGHARSAMEPRSA